eukprot:CAMPEP_0178409072 /NCGR_PEP_ID=MMETSP0689_2-20121128/20271_1 /TAXON_ID=160604 /ORGANISM="Amphidinium massartii, Strain CS-259" /LENGTH=491 /DNA_ID=CAMNT_0020030197 /DNA_START=136 /DNA_END=1611 /DNA_ORIENTATION=-
MSSAAGAAPAASALVLAGAATLAAKRIGHRGCQRLSVRRIVRQAQEGAEEAAEEAHEPERVVKVLEGTEEVELDGPRPAGRGSASKSGHPYFWKMSKDKRFIEVVFPIEECVTKDDIVYRMGEESRDPLRGPELQMGYRLKDPSSGQMHEEIVVDGNVLNRVDRRECFWNLEELGGVKVCVLTLARPRMTRRVHDSRSGTSVDEERLDPQTWDAILVEDRVIPVGTQKAFMDISIGGKDAGRLEFDLYGDDAPETVKNFIGLLEGHYVNDAGETVKSAYCLKGTPLEQVKGDQLIQAGQPNLEYETVELTHEELEEYVEYFSARKTVTAWPIGPIGMRWMLRWGGSVGVKKADADGFVTKRERESLDFEKDIPEVIETLKELVAKGEGAELVFFKTNMRKGVNMYGETFQAENFTIPHSARGMLSMDRDEDEDRQGSVFFITLREFPEMDGRYCTFGALSKGSELLNMIEEDCEDQASEVLIKDCGLLESP